MGKRYHCDYCDKTIVAAPSSIKTHNRGTSHQKLVNEHYQRYKEPEVILQEELTKKPCLRYAAGQCPFGSICRFSHYSNEDIRALQQYVSQKKSDQLDTQSFGDIYKKISTRPAQNESSNSKETIVYDSNGVTHVLPWSYNPLYDKYGKDLPPSLKRLKIEDFNSINISSWG
ncbi:zinc finger matrin-type protein 5 isoform X2 [Colias croceus]|uniref:zinc finger matrin-type protein 5 isoform X2 n=1 Tax=Colias crocea TaxID=72248 RepID=UPI001E280C18|nr:zinc finger matrin-type protein 5 isoform X2 [Colias croceus]